MGDGVLLGRLYYLKPQREMELNEGDSFRGI